MGIPPELLANPGPPLIIFFLAVACAVLWRSWQEAEKECNAFRDARASEAKVAADLATEQKIANVGALSTITFREFERDQWKDRAERCERYLDEQRDRTESRRTP